MANFAFCFQFSVFFVDNLTMPFESMMAITITTTTIIIIIMTMTLGMIMRDMQMMRPICNVLCPSSLPLSLYLSVYSMAPGESKWNYSQCVFSITKRYDSVSPLAKWKSRGKSAVPDVRGCGMVRHSESGR